MASYRCGLTTKLNTFIASGVTLSKYFFYLIRWHFTYLFCSFYKSFSHRIGESDIMKFNFTTISETLPASTYTEIYIFLSYKLNYIIHICY